MKNAATIPDLSEKTARPLVPSETPSILDWSTLLQAPGLPGVQHPVQKNPVRMLGYMMDWDRPYRTIAASRSLPCWQKRERCCTQPIADQNRRWTFV